MKLAIVAFIVGTFASVASAQSSFDSSRSTRALEGIERSLESSRSDVTRNQFAEANAMYYYNTASNLYQRLILASNALDASQAKEKATQHKIVSLEREIERLRKLAKINPQQPASPIEEQLLKAMEEASRDKLKKILTDLWKQKGGADGRVISVTVIPSL